MEMNEGTKVVVRVQTASRAKVQWAGFPPAPQIEEEEGFGNTKGLLCCSNY
jgi:hypothetical protein